MHLGLSSRSCGLLFALLSVTVFAIQDGVSKHIGALYPVNFVIMLRFWIFAMFVVMIAGRSKGGVSSAVRTRRPVLQIGRGLLLANQFVVSTYAFAHVGLAQTHAIFASTPLLVACLSVPILGEAVGWRRWGAIGIGFFGVLLIINPVDMKIDASVALPALCAINFALYSTLTRLVAGSDTPATSFFYAGMTGAVVMSIIGPFYWTTIAFADWPWMIALCLSGIAAHYFLIRAYDLLDAVVVQPMSYLQTVLVCIIGVVVYNETMTEVMVIGSTIVVLAGLLTIWGKLKVGHPIRSC